MDNLYCNKKQAFLLALMALLLVATLFIPTAFAADPTSAFKTHLATLNKGPAARPFFWFPMRIF
ncbi:hypothetical protein COLO4_29248 [Corchorus olitorius]|uniref:Uncharacterized protein n=1 Tax=Corchorus olitorius TaxID=93759 RepID=A0A1R3HFM2_9ROSI|nr:hypothetical protein COLO4_29248 [Corchorus olitorius]